MLHKVQDRNGAQSFYHVDGLGSTRALSDESGLASDRYIYDAFGQVLTKIGDTENSYLYAGEQRDSNLGLDYLRARYLGVDTGRFVSRDSFPPLLDIPLSLNRYLYANANSVNNIDPSGEITLSGIFASIRTFSANSLTASLTAFRLTTPIATNIINRAAYFYFNRATQIEIALAISSATLFFIDAGARAILSNTEPVPSNPGDFVEKKLSANATKYEIIDDFRDGHATSIKTSISSKPSRVLRILEKEARTVSDRIQKGTGFQRQKQFGAGALQNARSGGVTLVIPENNGFLLRNRDFVNSVRGIAQQTRTVIRVIPLRGWIVKKCSIRAIILIVRSLFVGRRRIVRCLRLKRAYVIGECDRFWRGEGAIVVCGVKGDLCLGLNAIVIWV